ncbi:FAD-binding oxidoreductase [Catenuloplanes sp. NPDC051500]|uniref:FAD-binding oxidoreductase n=1 Tax=Catenuloplanes sp. NPDC051500 TaxID=3363959 RepID=UPI00379E24B7
MPANAANGGWADATGRAPVGAPVVAGVPAALVARPADAAQVADVLRVAAAYHLAVVARGGGTRLDWGTPPSRLDLILDLSGLDRIIDHAAGDLVLVAEAGARLADVQRHLAVAGQRLAVDAPTPGATLGGTVATGHSGPSRLLAGPIKDQIIGISVVRPDGTPAISGGRVVKNVAGYDLGRLMCGSYGTLAVFTRLIFRLRPLPAARAFITAPILGPSLVTPLIEAIAGAQLAPSAIELDLPAPPRDPDLRRDAAGPAGSDRIHRSGDGSGPATSGGFSSVPGDGSDQPGARSAARGETGKTREARETREAGGNCSISGVGAVVVLVEGPAAGVAGRAAAVRELLQKAGAEEVHVRAEAPAWWAALPATGSGETLLRLTFVRSGLLDVVSAARDEGAALRGAAAAGVLTAVLPHASPERVAVALARLRVVCARHGGAAIVLDAPPAVRATVDMWGPVPALDLMRRVKDQFDPDRRLSPGRFVGGL